METVKPVIVILLTLAVVAIALFLAVTTLVPTIGTEGTEPITTQFTLIDGIGNSTGTILGFTNPEEAVLSNINVTNGTTAVPVNLTVDYTVNGGYLIATAASDYNNSVVNVTFNYVDDNRRQSNEISSNITTGATDFFSNMPTVFTILGAVVIILAVVLILFAVNRFGVNSGAGGFRTGGGSGESRL